MSGISKMSERKIVETRLKSNHGCVTDDELMNVLQNMGAVSDNCVTLSDVSNADLMMAYNKTITGE